MGAKDSFKHISLNLVFYVLTVRDVTWMSALSMHLAKWIPALGQVTDSHLAKLKSAKCTKFLIFMNGTWPSGTHWHSAKWYPGLLKG